MKIAYESWASKSYLVVEVLEPERLINYQVEMVRQNPGSGRVLMDIRQKDDKVLLYYDITGLVPVKYYIDRRKFDAALYLHTLLRASEVSMDSGCYLLDEGSFLLEKEFVFINPVSMEAAFVYLPLRLTAPHQPGIKEFAGDLLLEVSDFSKSVREDFASVLLSYIKSEKYTTKGLYKLLNDIYSGASENDPLTQKAEVMPEIRKEAVHSVPIEEIKPNREKKTGLTTKLTAALLIQLVIAGIVFAVSFFGKDLIGHSNVNMAAVILIAAAIDVIILKNLLKGGIYVDKQEKDINKSSENSNKVQIPAVTPRAKEIVTRDESVQAKKQAALTGISSDTMPLSDEIRKSPVLSGIWEGVKEEIHIKGSDFVIGRLEDQVDYVSRNSAIGKVHARFTLENGIYFITDLNSRNGSYINGVRLNSNTPGQLKNGDKVTLANMDYTFLYNSG